MTEHRNSRPLEKGEYSLMTSFWSIPYLNQVGYAGLYYRRYLRKQREREWDLTRPYCKRRSGKRGFRNLEEE